MINQSVNWDVLIPLLNNKPVHTSIQQRYIALSALTLFKVLPIQASPLSHLWKPHYSPFQAEEIRAMFAVGVGRGGASVDAGVTTGRLGDEGAGLAGRAREGGLPLVHRELDALLRHILSDLSRV